MRVIGHRGAAGLTLENTLPAFELARLLKLDAVELDVRLTKDQQLVVCHDAHLERISPSHKKIHQLTYNQLKEILLFDFKSTVPRLVDVLKLLGDMPVIVELKDSGSAHPLLNALDVCPTAKVSVASFKLNELTTLAAFRPTLRLYLLGQTNALETIQLARRLKLHGLGLNFWLINPLTYWLGRRSGLDIFVYTVNWRLLGQVLGWLYPNLGICTDHPEWFIHRRYLKRPTQP